jgi:MFS family permease
MARPMRELLKSRLSPFKQRHFRNFFFAQSLSMIGTFSHDLARSWIIVDTIGKSGALGNLQMAVAIPCLMFILHGGVYVDRANVRRLMMYTKSLMGLAACILAALTQYSTLEYWHLLVYGVIEGTIVAFDSPAFSALVVKMVPKEDFRQAISLNSTNFHTARMLGPVIAGLLMAWSGPSLVFLFDGVTYFLIAIVLSRIDVSKYAVAQAAVAKGWAGVREGLGYIFKTPRLRYRMTQLFITICFILPIVTSVFRVYIQQKFHLTSAEFGGVFMFPAFGSMAGAFTFAAFQPRDPLRTLFVSIPGAIITLVTLPTLNTLPLATACMTGIGFFLYLSFASLTVSMQLEVDERFRGRLSSVIQLGFVGIGPAMSAPWGHLADIIGPPRTIYLCAAGFLLSSCTLAYLQYRTLARNHKQA